MQVTSSAKSDQKEKRDGENDAADERCACHLMIANGRRAYKEYKVGNGSRGESVIIAHFDLQTCASRDFRLLIFKHPMYPLTNLEMITETER
jgi:hypothetical protein